VTRDVVGAQPAQRVLHGGHDPAPRGTLLVRVLPGRAAEFGGKHDPVPTSGQGPADDLFGVPVGVCSVNKVDASV
jgi:hypothetical protein